MRAFVLALLACFTAAEAMAQELVVPDAPDLLVKTRRTDSARESDVFTQILYLKGARQRRETWRGQAGSGQLEWISITQCDQRRQLMLNPEARTYGFREIEDPSAHLARLRKGTHLAPPPPNTPITTITIDRTDTGERRTLGSYTARHVITTRSTDPPGAGVGMRLAKDDGWYIDVPDSSCWGGIQAETFFIGTIGPPGSTRIERRGNGRRGYPIEETQRFTDGRFSHVARQELVEMSEAPLDDALFDVPKDYQPALPTPYGPDMSKPDTIVNRLSWYGNEMVLTVWHWFNPPAYGHGY